MQAKCLVSDDARRYNSATFEVIIKTLKHGVNTNYWDLFTHTRLEIGQNINSVNCVNKNRCIVECSCQIVIR